MHSVGQAMWSGVTPVALDKELNTTDLPRPPLIAAWPLGWYLMNNWLTEFVYRIEIEWPLLASTGLLALLLTLATVSFQAIKAARFNPVDALRYE